MNTHEEPENTDSYQVVKATGPLVPVVLDVRISIVDADTIELNDLPGEQAQALREEPEFVRRFDVSSDGGQQWTYAIGAYEFLDDEFTIALDTEAPIDVEDIDGQRNVTEWDEFARRPQFEYEGTIDAHLVRMPAGGFAPLSLLEAYRIDLDLISN